MNDTRLTTVLTVTVSGDAGRVIAASSGRLVVTGDDDVIPSGGHPQVSDMGDNNVIGS